jgi:hypothetical protein
MDDGLAAKVWAADVVLALSERLHSLIGLVDPGTPPDGASEQGLAAFSHGEERYRGEM